MAVKRNERYPGRYSNPTTTHPQGAFKNRTAPSAQDGSYLEQDWANDWDGFFGRLLTLAGITPNGKVDTALTSQYFDALRKLTLQRDDPFGDIVSDGTVDVALTNLGVSGGFLLGSPQIFTSSGTYTPNPKAKKIIVEVQGGGGGGAGTNSPSTMSSASGSGASGAYAKAMISNPTVQTITVGAGGLGGVANPSGNGNPGGQSSFGTLVTAVGGNGGFAMTAGSGILSATIAGTVPTVQFTGANIFGRGCGMPGVSTRFGAGVSQSGNGGDSQMGAGGLGSLGQSRGGNGTGPGAGGAGANVNGGVSASYTGGDGAAGMVIIWEYA